jgi:hypothetical protein
MMDWIGQAIAALTGLIGAMAAMTIAINRLSDRLDKYECRYPEQDNANAARDTLDASRSGGKI